ncbi:MAG: hypothetical protein MJ237_04390 [bacterium]|nr:hypothetical protein [bacterium]
MKKTIFYIFLLLLIGCKCNATDIIPVSCNVKLPEKYTDAYLDALTNEYKKVSNEQVVHIALDMMKNTSADYSRRAIMGFNLTQYPMQISFKNLTELNSAYETFDAVGWKKKNKLFIYINPKHSDAPPAAIAALIAHEALHQDEYNSLSEETYAWTMEACVWDEMIKMYPEENILESSLVARENTLRQLLEKGNYTNKYIKKAVYSNNGYKNLPVTSPGFNNQ